MKKLKFELVCAAQVACVVIPTWMLIGYAFVLSVGRPVQAKPLELRAPTCSVQSEACRDVWYAYGDETGDYGVIDAAE